MQAFGIDFSHNPGNYPRVLAYAQVQPSPAQFQFHSDSWARTGPLAVQETLMRNVVLRKKNSEHHDETLSSGRPLSSTTITRYRNQTAAAPVKRNYLVQQVTARGGLEDLPVDRLALEIVKHVSGLCGYYSLKKDSQVGKLVSQAMKGQEQQFFQQLADSVNSVGMGAVRMDVADRMRLDERTYIFLVRVRSTPLIPLRDPTKHRSRQSSSGHHHHHQRPSSSDSGNSRNDGSVWIEANHILTSSGRLTGFAWLQETVPVKSLVATSSGASLRREESHDSQALSADDDCVVVLRDEDVAADAGGGGDTS